MEIEETIVDYPHRRQVTELDGNSETVREFAADIERPANSDDTGTEITAELLTKVNWRDDKSLSFKVSDNANPSPQDTTKVQIMATSDQEVWLVPPTGENINLSKGLLTAEQSASIIDLIQEKTIINVHINDASKHVTVQDKARWDTKQNALTGQQINNIADVPNKLNESAIQNREYLLRYLNPLSTYGLEGANNQGIYRRNGIGYKCYGCRLSNGLVFNWGTFTPTGSQNPRLIEFAVPFANQVSFGFQATPHGNSTNPGIFAVKFPTPNLTGNYFTNPLKTLGAHGEYVNVQTSWVSMDEWGWNMSGEINFLAIGHGGI